MTEHTKMLRVRRGLERWYRQKGLEYVTLEVQPDGDGDWKFWRVDRDGDAECGTSYRHRSGRIEFYGSLEPEPEEDEAEEGEDEP